MAASKSDEYARLTPDRPSCVASTLGWSIAQPVQALHRSEGKDQPERQIGEGAERKASCDRSIDTKIMALSAEMASSYAMRASR